MVELGMAEFHRSCNACHGAMVMATGGAPDLRESGIAFDREAFGKFLREAPYLANGMPRFDDLRDAQVDQIYQYIRWEARNYIFGKSLDSSLK